MGSKAAPPLDPAQIQLEENNKSQTPAPSMTSSSNALKSGIGSSDDLRSTFLKPLTTQAFELEDFFNEEQELFQKNPRYADFLKEFLLDPIFSGKIYRDPDDPQYKLQFNATQGVIQKMPFDMYCKFRNHQIKRIREEVGILQRLELKKDPDSEDVKLKTWAKIKQKLPWMPDNFEARKAYLKQIKNLYEDVSIEIDQKNPNKAYIKSGVKENDDEDGPKQAGKTLITITSDHSNNLNNMVFEINPSIKDPKELDKAICVMMDQAVRNKERSVSNRLEISGYHNRPDIVLRIYQLAILQGHRPTINNGTLAAWQAKANDPNNPDQNKFQQAIDFHTKYEKIATQPFMSGHLAKWIALKKGLMDTNLNDYLKAKANAKTSGSAQPATEQPPAQMAVQHKKNGLH